MQIVIAALLMLSLPAHAQSNIPGKIDRANRKVKQMQGPDVCTTCGFPAGREAPPGAWQACLREICGDSLNARNKELLRLLSPRNQDPELQKFASAAQETYKSEIAVEAELLRLALNKMNSSPQVTDPLANQMGQMLTALADAKYLQLDVNSQVDPQQTYDQFRAAGKSHAEADLAMEVARSTSGMSAKRPALFADDFAFVRQTMTSEEIRRGINGAFSSMEATLKKNRDALGAAASILETTPGEIRALKLRLSADPPSAKDVAKLKSEYDAAVLTDMLINNPDLKARAQKGEFKVAATFNKAVATKDLKEMDDFLNGKPQGANSRLNLAGAAQTQIASCRTAMALTSADLPTQRDITHFIKNEEPTVRSKFFGKLKPYLSNHSAEVIGAEFNKALVKPPPSRDQFLHEFKDSLDDLAFNNRRLLSDLKKPMADSGIQAVYAVLAASRPDLENDAQVNTRLKKLCNANFPEAFGDRASLDGGRFQLSGTTMNGGSDSHFICNHEYGHLISSIVQQNAEMSEATKGWFHAVRSCLKQGHDQNGEALVEEDFADAMGFTFTGAGIKWFCGHIPNEEDSLTLQNWNPEDHDHAGDLYRVLHARVLNGDGIPENCKSALSEKGETPFERNCLKETPEASTR